MYSKPSDTKRIKAYLNRSKDTSLNFTIRITQDAERSVSKIRSLVVLLSPHAQRVKHLTLAMDETAELDRLQGQMAITSYPFQILSSLFQAFTTGSFLESLTYKDWLEAVDFYLVNNRDILPFLERAKSLDMSNNTFVWTRSASTTSYPPLHPA